ncbi:MAG: response regulator, partial [Candidatus Eremiobacterota bacterium]
MSQRILVLEDDSHMRGTLVRLLDEEGYQVSGVASGPEAIALSSRSEFDLIVADIRMEGMDGLECLASLRQVRPSMKSIVITGYASTDAPARALKVQAEDYLHKPFQLQ